MLMRIIDLFLIYIKGTGRNWTMQGIFCFSAVYSECETAFQGEVSLTVCPCRFAGCTDLPSRCWRGFVPRPALCRPCLWPSPRPWLIF